MPRVLDAEESKRLKDLEAMLKKADEDFTEIEMHRKFLIAEISRLKGCQPKNVFRRTNCRDAKLTKDQLRLLASPVGIVFNERTTQILMDLGVFDVRGLKNVSEADILSHKHSNSEILLGVKKILSDNGLPPLRVSRLTA